MRTMILSTLFVFLGASFVCAQQVGDRVVVTANRAKLKARNETVGTVPMGNVLAVKKVDATWFWVSWSDGRTTAKGWISHRDVTTFEKGVEFIDEELRRKPNSYLYLVRGGLRIAKGECDRALMDFNESIRLDPTNAVAWSRRAGAWSYKGEYDKALGDCDEAIRLYPNDATFYNNRGFAWAGKGEYNKAISDYDTAIGIDAAAAIRFANRGTAWRAKGEYRNAIADYNEALRLEPECPGIHCALALIFAGCSKAEFRDGKRAVEFATVACERNGWRDVGDIFTLAAAYAEAGDFTNAVKWQGFAVGLAPGTNRDFCKSVLALYKDNKPYRESSTR